MGRRLVDDLTYRIRESLDVGVERPAPGIAEFTTPSLEAYRLYKEGGKKPIRSCRSFKKRKGE